MKLRVVHVIGNSIIGGAERHLVDLVDGLRKFEVESLVICPRPGPLVELLATRNIPVAYVEMSRLGVDGWYVADTSAIIRVVSHLKRILPHIVHSHLYPADFVASQAAYLTHIPGVVQTIHSLDLMPEQHWLSQKTGLYTIAVSNAVAKVVEDAGISTQQIEVIFNGVGPEHFESNMPLINETRIELSLKPGPVVIGTVSRLSPEKGVDNFLKALKLLQEKVPSVTALIVGDGPQLAELQQLARDLDIDNTVVFTGTREDIPVINRLIDIFVLASRKEALSLSVLEAMAAGRPVIATSVGGIPEIIEHKINGWLVPPKDPAALAEALLTLVADPTLCAALGKAAQIHVSAFFRQDQMIQHTLSFYQRILSNSTAINLSD